MFKLLLDSQPELISGSVVHLAPDKALVKLMRSMSDNYVTADLNRSDVDLNLNIEVMSELPDESVDTFIASHILEHVDDKKALSAMHRCLRSGGKAILAFPIIEAWRTTYENPSVTTSSGRDLHFGQFDHVRYYGADVRRRIEDAGFRLAEFTAFGEDCVRHGLVRGETIFIAVK